MKAQIVAVCIFVAGPKQEAVVFRGAVYPALRQGGQVPALPAKRGALVDENGTLAAGAGIRARAAELQVRGRPIGGCSSCHVVGHGFVPIHQDFVCLNGCWIQIDGFNKPRLFQNTTLYCFVVILSFSHT